MCLGVPGRVILKEDGPHGLSMGRVDFDGVTREVCLAYVPDAEVGDYVVVHVGFAIAVVDEVEAARIISYLEAMDELAELAAPQPD
jgi:hydrogenase expression/formation protein HypC